MSPVHNSLGWPDTVCAPLLDALALGKWTYRLSSERRLFSPGQFASLWGMLQAYASFFVKLRDYLLQMEEIFDGDILSKEVSEDTGQKPEFANQIKEHRQKVWRLLQEILKKAEDQCSELNLKMSVIRIERIREKCVGASGSPRTR